VQVSAICDPRSASFFHSSLRPCPGSRVYSDGHHTKSCAGDPDHGALFYPCSHFNFRADTKSVPHALADTGSHCDADRIRRRQRRDRFGRDLGNIPDQRRRRFQPSAGRRGKRRIYGSGLEPGWEQIACLGLPVEQLQLGCISRERRRNGSGLAGRGSSPSWSPDGQRIAYSYFGVGPDNQQANHQIHTVKLDGAGSCGLADGLSRSGGRGLPCASRTHPAMVRTREAIAF